MRDFPIEHIQQLPQHYTLTIPPDYLDVFGHMNVQYYMALFNESTFGMFDSFGMGEAYFWASSCGVFALEQHIRYYNEIRGGATVTLHSRLLGRSEKRLHFMQIIINHDEQNLPATMEGIGMHVNIQTCCSEPFLADYARMMDARIQSENALDWSLPLVEKLKP